MSSADANPRQALRPFEAKSDAEIKRLLRKSHVKSSARKARGASATTRSPNRPWTEEENKMLGRMPDREVARLTARSLESVQLRRSRRGIAPFDALLRRWTPAEERLLGTMTDEEVAKTLNRGLDGVRIRRQKLKIPLPPKKKGRVWTARQDKLIAENASEAMRVLGLAKSTVYRRRKQLGARNKRRPWTKGEERLLGTMPDRKLARQLGRTEAGVTRLGRRRRAKRSTGRRPRAW